MIAPEQQKLFIELGCFDFLKILMEDMVESQNRWENAIRLLEDAINPRLKDCPIQYDEWLKMTNHAIVQFKNTKSIL